MLLREIIWKERFASKIEAKHGVVAVEVEEVLLVRPYARRAERGRAPNLRPGHEHRRTQTL